MFKGSNNILFLNERTVEFFVWILDITAMILGQGRHSSSKFLQIFELVRAEIF